MDSQFIILAITAASIGFFHTLLGPDHYVPFVAMAKARKWEKAKTFWITLFCGIGHILGSVVLGLIGIIAGISITKIEIFESLRGDLAGWMLIAFGFAYLIYGIRKIYKNKPHSHFHQHEDGTLHTHNHNHQKSHAHVHEEKNKSITPWILFTIFIFGPCEALIPLLMYPAVNHSFTNLISVVLIFGVMTIATMLSVVFASLYGLDFLPIEKFSKYSHSIAGALILICGISVTFLGL